jgi:hypothetical protein
MAINLPKKYSRKTLILLDKNESVNLVMTPGATEVSIPDAEIIDKTNQLVTKQSVLDIFNKQVLDRINLLPKYSRDYFFVDTGGMFGPHDENIHRNLVSMLGNAYLNNDYGFMCMHDYVKLSDFRDQEGEITYDDLANTFSNVMKSLSRLSRLSITVKRGNKDFYKETRLAISPNFGIPSSYAVNYAEVRNEIIDSRRFNGICYKWYNQIVSNAMLNTMSYTYKLPDPPLPSDGGVKLFKKEAYFESVNLGYGGRTGQNSVSYDTIFGEGETTAFFDVPRITRNLKGISLNITTSARLSDSGRYGITVYHKFSNVILGHINWTHGTGNRTFYFERPITLSESSYDDLVFMLNTKVTGDRGDAMGMVASINELIFDDEVHTSPILLHPKVDISKMNSELEGPIFDTDSNSEILNITYKYTVRDWHLKPSVIRTLFNNSHDNNHLFVERIEHWRDGNRINTSLNPTYSDKITNHNTIYRYSRFNGNRHNTLITMKHDVSNLDVRNGDELRFVYGYYNVMHAPGWGGNERLPDMKKSVLNLKTFQSSSLSLRVDDILNKQELIG